MFLAFLQFHHVKKKVTNMHKISLKYLCLFNFRKENQRYCKRCSLKTKCNIQVYFNPSIYLTTLPNTPSTIQPIQLLKILGPLNMT